jgi:hypothetical protein
MHFQGIINELLELSECGVLRMNKIQGWLITHSDLYKKTYDSVYSQHLFTDYDDTTIRLPPCGEPTYKEIFLSLYESLNGILELHANETYFENEMVEYYKIINSPSDIKTWIVKNEDLGAEQYVCFLIDHLDYVENGHEEHLSVYIYNSKELRIFIDRQDFKNTIDFIEIFNELYWVQERILKKTNKSIYPG